MPNDWTALDALANEFSAETELSASVVAPDGELWAWQGDLQLPSASTVKIPIMVQIYRMLDAGELSLDDHHGLGEDLKSPGSGVLAHMHEGLSLSLADLLYLMISISDNTATNMLIKLAGMANINATMRHVGMSRSILGRPMRGRLAKAGEQENLATANDYMDALRAIVDGRAAREASCRAMLATLALQQNGRRIGRYVPTGKDYRWGSKTGTNQGVVNDVGFVTGPAGTLLIGVFCRGVADEVSGEQLISTLTRQAMRATGLLPAADVGMA